LNRGRAAEIAGYLHHVKIAGYLHHVKIAGYLHHVKIAKKARMPR